MESPDSVDPAEKSTSPPPPAADGGGAIAPSNPPQDPILILVLNLFVGGCLGYFKIGQTQKAIAALISFIGLAFVALCAGPVFVAILAAIDGYMQAQQLEAGHPIGQWTFLNDHR